jgi:group I intron endonuclease
MGLVYLITNTVNGKRYVGKTQRGLHRRWREHCDSARQDSRYLIHRAIQKYGATAFTREAVAEAESLPDLNRLECEWISRLGTIAPGGYNLTRGGEGVAGPAQETRKRMSDAKRGKPLSPEHCRKIGLAVRGRVFTAEHRRKIGDANRNPSEETRRRKGIAHLGNTNTKGMHWSDEQRARMGAGKRGKKMSEEARQKLIGRHPTEATRKKMSESAKHKPPMSEETRRRFSVAASNHSAESRMKISRANTGRKHTAEVRQRMSESAKARWARVKASGVAA